MAEKKRLKRQKLKWEILPNGIARAELYSGDFVLIDHADLSKVIGLGWYAHKRKNHSYAWTNAYIGGKRTIIQMHRLIMGAPHGKMIDHKDGNGLNNCRSNLRFASFSQNAANVKSRSKHGFKGVSFHKRDRNYRASMMVNGRVISLGYYRNAVDAAKAYDKAALIHFGQYARTNFGGEHGQTAT